MFQRNLFVTNSSSAHCIVTGAKVQNVDDDRCGNTTESYGWEPFILVSEEAKLRYLAALLFTLFGGDSTMEERADKINEFFDLPVIDMDYGEDFYYIDHNSLSMDLPRTENGEIDLKEIAPFCDRIINSPDVAIVGGNDNSDRYEPFEGNYCYTDRSYKELSERLFPHQT